MLTRKGSKSSSQARGVLMLRVSHSALTPTHPSIQTLPIIKLPPKSPTRYPCLKKNTLISTYNQMYVQKSTLPPSSSHPTSYGVNSYQSHRLDVSSSTLRRNSCMRVWRLSSTDMSCSFFTCSRTSAFVGGTAATNN